MLDELARGIFGVDAARLAPVFLLVLARTAPLAWVAPWLGWRGTAGAVRVALAGAIALALTPLALQAAPALPEDALPLALLGIREVLVGAAFAIAVSAPLYALGWAGALADRWRGSPAADAPDASPLRAAHLGAGVVVFVSIGGHRLALAAFGRAIGDVPPGSGAQGDLATLGLGVARVVADALELALAIVAPTALALVILEVVVALWGRFAPGLRAFFAALPLRAALGVAVALIGLSVLLPRLGPAFARSIETASELVR